VPDSDSVKMGRIQLVSKQEGLANQPRVEDRTNPLSDAAVTYNYFRRMHEMQAKDAGPLTKLVVWITGGVKTPR
jgi:hypothetical protein